mgnify:CR=1 FL=1
MARVFIPALLTPLTGGESEIEAEGSNVGQVIAALDALYPGFGEVLLDQGRLRPNIAVAIDDEIATLGVLESVSPSSEIHFVTAIRGG